MLKKAVAFYTDVFGVAPHVLLNMPDGRVMHCEFRIGNGGFSSAKNSRNMVARQVQPALLVQALRIICTSMTVTRWSNP